MLQSHIFLLPSNLVWRKSLRLLPLLLLLCLTARFGYGQTKGHHPFEGVALEPGTSIRREFAAAADEHIYRLTLSANQYASVVVEQSGVDIIARLLTADGQLIADIDAEMTARGTERVELVAKSAGIYHVGIRPGLPKAFAGSYTIRLSEARAATENEKLLDEARRQYYESIRQNDAGNFDRALEVAHSALEIREKIAGANQADVAASLLVISRLYLVKNNLKETENYVRRALELITKNNGAESLSHAEALSVLARLRHAQANYAEAETLHLKALALREKHAGANSLAVADTLQNLGVLYRAMNDYARAEQSFTKALTIYENLLGDNRFEMAQVLNNFGMFYYGAGDFDKALALLHRSLAIKEKSFPQVHRQIGIAFNNLGLVAWKKGDYEKARTYYQRALSIFEIVNGPESDGVANILANLGIIYKEFDINLVKAEESYKRALAIREKLYGEYHAATADLVSSLALLYRRAGDNERAEQFGLRALAIYERVLGEYNHYTLLAFTSLIRIYAAKGDARRAIEYAKRLSEIHEKVIPLNLRTGSERQKIAYYKLTERFDKIITLHARLAPDDAAGRDLAATAILRHKGRVLDAVSANLSALRLRFDAEDRKLLDQLNEVNARLSKMILSSPQKISLEEQQKQIKAIETEREKLESEISRRSAGFYEPSQPVMLDAVRNAIPADAALVEFAVYRPFDWKAEGDSIGFGKPHVIVYILRPTGEVQWKELGEAQTINAAISELRKALRDPQRKDVRKLARAVDEKVMQPVRALVGKATHLLVSPDGELNLIPFEALVDEKGAYEIENYSFTYLTSGRDLLRMRVARSSRNRPLIFANPQFGAPATAEPAADASMADSRMKRRSMTNTRNLSDTYFAPLGGTIQEARSIQTQFPDALVLSGAEATETALKEAVSPRILHIATHAFFLEEEDATEPTAGAASQTPNRNSNPTGEPENPLLRSGIALAGANRREGAKDDGMLTALEASGLNLWGTRLVILSACDTGIGEVKNGEGVYGLRRSFVLAGTETLMMSLWPVSDYATRELMTSYYKNLKQGLGRGAALRQVQLDMLKRKGREHPFYWAAFIQSGEWTNLDDKR